MNGTQSMVALEACRLMGNLKPMTTFEKAINDLNNTRLIRCITSHSGVIQLGKGKFGPTEHYVGEVLPRNLVRLRNPDFWVLETNIRS